MDQSALHVLRTARLARLEALLVASGAAPSRVHGIEDAADLLGSPGGTVFYDADAVPVEDLGILARVQRSAHLIAITGGRTQAHRPRSFQPDSILEWPIDVDELERVATGHRGVIRADELPDGPRTEVAAGRPAEAEAPPAPAPAPRSAGAGADLGAIERILRGAEVPAAGVADRRLWDESAEEPDAGRPDGPWAVAPRRRATWVRRGGRAGANGQRRSDATGQERPRTTAPATDHPATPQTAFLRTRIQPARRSAPVGPPPHDPHPVQPTAGRGAGDAPATATATGSASGPASSPGTGLLARAFEDDGPLLTDAELEAFFDAPPPIETALPDETDETDETGEPDETGEADDDVGPGASPRSAAATDATEHRPPWLRAQVADLADIVQALDLRARAGHAHAVIGDDLARLRQFTRTIGFVAAPPAGDEQDFDLASFVEEQLGEVAGVGPDAPRLLFRRMGGGSPSVFADKSLVALAFDALLQTALACAGSGDVVRVSVTAEAGTGRPAPPVTARIDFPRGPLADLAPRDLLRPYALSLAIPMIGPNALAAAGGIAVGQGGDLVVEEGEGGRIAFLLDLPAAG